MVLPDASIVQADHPPIITAYGYYYRGLKSVPGATGYEANLSRVHFRTAVARVKLSVMCLEKLRDFLEGKQG